jgi:tetratricopeptide (TPR) repeat protein
MKAERRHELKTNTLAAKLEKAPAFFQQYGSRISLGLILCLLTAYLVFRYVSSRTDKAIRASENLGEAVFTLNDMRLSEGRGGRDLHKKVEEYVSAALENSSDPKVRAAALIMRGDANWEAANTPVAPAATTRPELAPPKKSDEYLAEAEKAYKEVLQPPLDTVHSAVISARLGLGAISENRRQFSEAKNYYQQVISDSAADNSYKELARKKLDELTALQTPVFIGTKSDLSEEPIEFSPHTRATSAPAAASSPSTAPATHPTTPGVLPTTPTPTTPATPATATAPARKHGATTRPVGP